MKVYIVMGTPHLSKEPVMLGIYTSMKSAKLAKDRAEADRCTEVYIEVKVAQD